ncbi:Glycosyltransferase [Candidatus Magnetomoraceae bacterium gMMP-15]
MKKHKILMILPQEFMAFHGSGIQVRNRLKAILEKDNYQIDLLTLPYGEDITLQNLNIIRLPRLPFLSSKIKIGPSFKKIIYDFLLSKCAYIMSMTRSYSIVYTHEEAGFMGALIRKIFKIPHIYEMHSFLPQGMCNYNACNKDDLIFKLTCIFEKFILKNTDNIIAISPDIKEQSLRLYPQAKIRNIENCFIEGESDINYEKLNKFKNKYNPDLRPTVIYTGNMSEFQGVDILLESIKHVRKVIENVRFFIVGLSEDEIMICRKFAQKNYIVNNLKLIPRRPVEEIPFILKSADCLVSPRKTGSNTPYKLYTYLAAGIPIVATRIKSHLTAITDNEVFFVEPEAKDMAEGIIRALCDKKAAENKVNNAINLYYKKFSWSAFKKSVQEVITEGLGEKL